MRARTLVLDERRVDSLRARFVRALADERRIVRVEALCRLGDTLVHGAKERFGACDPFFVLVHRRLPIVITRAAVDRLRASLQAVWPPTVEVIAAVFRAAGADARLEELPPGEDELPGLGVRVEAFDCDGRVVVALVPADRDVDVRKLGCDSVSPADVPPFPFTGSKVVLDSSLLPEPTVWLEAGSERHVVGVAPSQLLQIVDAQTGDLVVEA